MKTSSKVSQISSLIMLVCLVFVSLACRVLSLPTPAPIPTATLPAEADSSLKATLLGQWKIVNGGAWGDAILTFSDDGSFSVLGGLREKDAKGDYYFTSENTIAFQFPDYQGTATIEFDGNNKMSLTVATSEEPFGTIYSAEKIK